MRQERKSDAEKTKTKFLCFLLVPGCWIPLLLAETMNHGGCRSFGLSGRNRSLRWNLVLGKYLKSCDPSMNTRKLLEGYMSCLGRHRECTFPPPHTKTDPLLLPILQLLLSTSNDISLIVPPPSRDSSYKDTQKFSMTSKGQGCKMWKIVIPLHHHHHHHPSIHPSILLVSRDPDSSRFPTPSRILSRIQRQNSPSL